MKNLINSLKNLVFSKNQPKSTHRAEVVPVTLEKHPNADLLSIVRVGGYQLCVKTDDWLGQNMGVYIQPDSIVPDTVDYAFLGRAIKDVDGKVVAYEPLRPSDRRVTAKKFRGERSEGLLMPAPRGAKVGDNVADRLGISRYVSRADLREQEEAARFSNGWWHRINRRGRQGLAFSGNEKGPSIWIPIYDLENWYRYPTMFKENDYVTITEKVHGCNARFVYSSLDKRMYAGSRQTWKRPFYAIPYKRLWQNIAVKLGLMALQKQESPDDWNKIPKRYPQIETFCRANPDHVLFGEIYGDVQDLRYGMIGGQQDFVAFDVFFQGAYWHWQDVRNACEMYNIPRVPELYTGQWDEAVLRTKCIDGKTLLGSDKKQIREGCVIRLWNLTELSTERGVPGRKILKAVSSAYLERSSKDEEQPIVKRIEENDRTNNSPIPA